MGSFRDFLYLTENAMRPGNKAGLYPPGYGGIGLYPPQAYLPAAGDAVLYITQDERFYRNGDGPPFSIKHIPGQKPPTNPNNGDGPPFSIRHVR